MKVRSIAISLCLLLPLFLHTSCGKDAINPSRVIVTQTRDIDAFTHVEVSHAVKVYLRFLNGHTGTLEVRANDNIIDYIETTVIEGKLLISMPSSPSFKGNPVIEVRVDSEFISSASCSGGGHIICRDDFVADDFALTLVSGSAFSGEIEAGTISATLSGGSRIVLEGTCNTFLATCSGGSLIKNYNLAANDADVNLSGGSIMEQTVHGTINISAHGGSKFRYKGEGTFSRTDISANSSVEKK